MSFSIMSFGYKVTSVQNLQNEGSWTTFEQKGCFLLDPITGLKFSTKLRFYCHWKALSLAYSTV